MALTTVDAARRAAAGVTVLTEALDALAARSGQTVHLTIEPSLAPGALDRALNDALRRDALSQSLPLLKRKVG